MQPPPPCHSAPPPQFTASGGAMATAACADGRIRNLLLTSCASPVGTATSREPNLALGYALITPWRSARRRRPVRRPRHHSSPGLRAHADHIRSVTKLPMKLNPQITCMRVCAAYIVEQQ